MEANLYSPVFCDIWEPDEYGGYGDGPVKLSQRDVALFIDEIHAAIIKERMPEEAERGLMIYYGEADTVNEKVQSLFVDVDVRGGKLWAVATIDLAEPLTPEELKTLCEYITGQYSDGFGEGFEQREVKVEGGELNVHLWTNGDEFFIDTQWQFAQRLGIELPADALSPETAGVWDAAAHAASKAIPHMITEERQRLNERVKQNWDDYRETQHNATPDNLFNMAVQVVARRDAYQFIKDYDGFTAEQINCLLQFADPVELVADYLDPKSDISEMPGILENIMEEQETFKYHYALITDPATFEELQQRLRDRLAENYGVYKRDMLDLSKEEVFHSAREISSVQEAYEYFTKEHNFTKPDVDFLLKFQRPLELISDRWSDRMGIDEMVKAIFSDQERMLQKGGYTLVSDSPGAYIAPVSLESTRKITDAEKKQAGNAERLPAKYESVLAKIEEGKKNQIVERYKTSAAMETEETRQPQMRHRNKGEPDI